MEQLRKTVLIILAIGGGIALLYFTKELLMPLALAALLAMLFRGISNRLERRGWKRWATALGSVLAFLLGIAIILSLLAWQLSNMMENFSEMRDRAAEQVSAFRDWLQSAVGLSRSEQEEAVKQTASASAESGNGGLAAFALGAAGILVDVVLVIVYIFLLLFYRARIKTFIIQSTPVEHRDKARHIIQDASGVAQQYLVGLIAMIAVLWVLYGIGFSIIGVEGALFFAVLCGTLEIVPFVGNLVGTSITVLAVIAQGGNIEMILAVVGVYIFVQGLQTYILEPVIVGNQVNINPLFIVISLIAGELLWGIGGMVLAIPMLGIAKIICDRVGPLKPIGLLIGGEKNETDR